MFKFLDAKKDNGTYIVSVSAGKDYWKGLNEKAFDALAAKLELKGFRKGKVPAEIAKQTIKNEQIWHEAVNLLIDEKVEEINQEISKEKIIATPKIEVTKLSADEVEIAFKAPLFPEVKVGDLAKFKLEMDNIEPTEEENANELKQIESILVKQEEVEEQIQTDDVANINFVGRVDGKEFDGGKADAFDLKIGSKSFIDNFEDQLIGMKKGDSKTITVKFPETYPVEDLAGKDADFDVTINSVKRDVELSEKEIEEKVKSFGFDSLEQLKESILKTFAEKKKMDVYNSFIRKVLAEILEDSETVINLPEEVLADEIERQWNGFKDQLTKSNMKVKDYLKMIGKTEQEFKDADLRTNASKNLNEQLLFEKVDQELAFEVSDKEAEDKLQEIADLQKMELAAIKEQIKLENIKSELRFIKIVEFFKK